MKNKKNFRALTSVFLAVMVAAACMPGLTFSSFGTSVRRVNKITKASQTNSRLCSTTVGSQVTLKYKISPSKLPASAKKVAWKTSNNKIVKISKVKSGSAVATFKAAGKATVTVRSRQNSRVKATWNFSVLSAETVTQLTGVTIAAKNSSQDAAKVVQVGDTLRAAAAPEGATATYQWYADGTAIKNATGSRYSASKKDVGKALSVKATGTGQYAGEAESADTAKVTRTSSTSGSATVVIVNTPENNLPALKVTRVGNNVDSDDPCVTGDVLRVTLADSKSVTADQLEIKWYVGTPGGSSTELTMDQPDVNDEEDITAEEDGKFYQDYKIPSIPFSVSKTFGNPTIYAAATGKGDYEGSTSVSKPITVDAESDGDSFDPPIMYTTNSDGFDISSGKIPTGGGYTISVDCKALTDEGLKYGEDYIIRWTVIKREGSNLDTGWRSEIIESETTGKDFAATDKLEVDEFEVNYTNKYLTARIEGKGEYSGTTTVSYDDYYLDANLLTVYNPLDIRSYLDSIVIYDSDNSSTYDGATPLSHNHQSAEHRYLIAVPKNEYGDPLDSSIYTVTWIGKYGEGETYNLGTGSVLDLDAVAVAEKQIKCSFNSIEVDIEGTNGYTGSDYKGVLRGQIKYLPSNLN